ARLATLSLHDALPIYDAHDQVAAPAALELRQALAAHAQQTARLRARRDADARRAGYAGNVNLGAERSLRERDGQLGDEVRALAHEARVFLHLEHDDDVAARTAARADAALPAHRDVVAGRNTGRDVDLDRRLALLEAAAVALA